MPRTKFCDGQTDRLTDGRTGGQGDSSIPPNFVGYNKFCCISLFTKKSQILTFNNPEEEDF